MFQGLKRWFANPQDATVPASGLALSPKVWSDVGDWARDHHSKLRSVQDEGFVIDGRAGGRPEGCAWRLEWGPAQRPYIKTHELRLRADVQLPGDLQLVVMNRGLQEAMEKAIFEQYVEGVQTRIDHQTPPEMRWLVMYPRLTGSELGALRASFVAVASAKPWLLSWLEGPLTRALLAAPLDATLPVALMVGRGRLMLRTALAEPDLHSLQSWLALFETAIAEAARVARHPPQQPPATPAPSTWSASVVPGVEGRG